MRAALRLAAVVVAAVAIGVVLVAPSNDHTGRAARVTGGIAGRLMRVGGPPPGTAVPIRGTVTAVNLASGARVVVEAGRDGRWGATVPVGTYRVGARSPEVEVCPSDRPCEPARVELARPVVVAGGSTVRVTIYVSVP